MVGYMKRYDAGNELVKAKLEAYRASGELGAITYARNHGFCGDWIAGLDTPMDRSPDPMPDAQAVGPEWLPDEFIKPYLGYLQQYTHNVNLLRWFLNAGDDVRVRTVDFDADGYTGVVIFDMAGVRAVLESGRVSHYRWDEETQIYFQDGWIKTWAPPLLLKQVPAEVEIYRPGEEQVFTRPIAATGVVVELQTRGGAFHPSVQTGAPFLSSAEDTRTDVRLFEEIFRSYLEQRRVL